MGLATASDVEWIRAQLDAEGYTMRPATDRLMIGRVIGRTCHVEVALDAICMRPRPAWLRELIGFDLTRAQKRG